MRSAIYVRVSTVTHSQQHTIEEQIDRLRARLLSRGEAPADEHTFRDEGRSGATLNRPALDRLRDHGQHRQARLLPGGVRRLC